METLDLPLGEVKPLSQGHWSFVIWTAFILLCLVSFLRFWSLNIMASANTYECVFQRHTGGKPLRSSAKVIVLNVYTKLREKNTTLSINEIVQQCSELTGVSMKSVYNMKKEMETFGKFSTPGKKRPLKVGTERRNQIYDDFTKTAIRKKVHSFFFKNEIPTVRKVMFAINEDGDLPNFSLNTVRRLMKDLGFEFKKRNNSSVLIEREDIQLWRRQYLRNINKFRKEGRKIYYTDETWVNTGHTKQKVWQDTTIHSQKDAFLRGLSSGLKPPSGRGSRLIVVHVGSEDGFVDGCGEIFKAKKNSGDYHGEMNGQFYEEWFQKKLLPKLQPGSIIVMDNAPYHSVHVEKIPSSATRKETIQQWLTEKNISWNPDMLKTELLKLVANNKSFYEAYKIDKIASEHGHTVLRLPPYHCELNPIELIWSQVKGYVSAENRTFKADEILRLTHEGIEKASSSWHRCVDHIKKEEEKMWELDGLAETTVETLQFTVGDSSDSEIYTDEDGNLSGIEPLP